MAKVIAIANQKGGVGKTTTSINLSASMTYLGQRVLLIDLDPQGNTTTGSGIDKSDLKYSATEVLTGEVSVHVAIQKTANQYDLLPSNRDLTAAEVQLMQMSHREYRLLQALVEVRSQYDFIFIDCPPSLNSLTLNALVASDSVLIPLQCEYYALEGLTDLVGTIEQIKGSLNNKLSVEGILRTMFDARNRLSDEVSEQLFQYFGDKVYKSVIPRNIRLAEAPSHGQAAIIYDKTSTGARAYLDLAKEILDKRQSEFSRLHDETIKKITQTSAEEVIEEA